MAPRIVILAALTLCHPCVARAQLTSEEHQHFNKLLAEPDAKPSFDKRLRLIGDAIERDGDPKRRPSSSIVVDLKRARIPAAEGVPFLLPWLNHQAEVTKRTALRMLAAYGAEAKAAVPTLRQRMRLDPIRDVRNDAMVLLTRIEPDNAEIAAEILERLGAADADDTTNRAVLQALLAVAPQVPKAAVPRIAKFLDHKWVQVGIFAHELIGKVQALKQPTLEELRTIETIDWRNSADQGYATMAAIAQAGNQADFAMPLLVELLESGPPIYLDCAALQTLGKVKTGNPRVISAYLERMAAKDPMVRFYARNALMGVDLKEPASVRALAQGLRHEDTTVRMETGVVLRNWDQQGKLPPKAHAELLTPLLEAIQEVTEKVPPGQLDTCLTLLRRFGNKGAPAADKLLAIYRSESYFKKFPATFGAPFRGKVLAALANIGVPESGRPLVVEALKKGPTHVDDAGYAFTAAARAVTAFAEPKRDVPLLMPALAVQGKEREFYFVDWSGDGLGRPTTARLEAIRALAKMGAEAKEALPLLKDVALTEVGKATGLAGVVQVEARRTFNAIAKELGEPPLPFVVGKLDFLHLDERLQVKVTMKLQNPRPQHIVERLQSATKVPLSMDGNVDQETPATAYIHAYGSDAFNSMRQLAVSIGATWEQVGAGYRLVGKAKAADHGLAKTAKGPALPFHDDGNDPLMNDPRLQGSLTINLQKPTVPDLLQLLQKATGVTLSALNVDTANPFAPGLVSWSNTTAGRAMRNIAAGARVQGTWEKTAEGYLLRGKGISAAAPVPAAVGVPMAVPAVADASPAAPNSRLWLVLAVGGFLTVLVCGALAWMLRPSPRGAAEGQRLPR